MDRRDGFAADSLQVRQAARASDRLLGLQIGNYTAFIHAILGGYALEAMTATRIFAFAAMFCCFAIAIALAGMHSVAMHFVTGAHCGSHTARRAVCCDSGRH